MEFVALSTIIILVLIAGIHFYWVFGGDIGLDKALPTSADGRRLLNPGKTLTAFVGFVMLGFAFVAYKLYFDNSELFSYAGWAIAVVFFMRSIGEFNAVGFFKKIKNTPFAKYDTLFYSPLCLFLAFSYILLICRNMQ